MLTLTFVCGFYELILLMVYAYSTKLLQKTRIVFTIYERDVLGEKYGGFSILDGIQKSPMASRIFYTVL